MAPVLRNALLLATLMVSTTSIPTLDSTPKPVPHGGIIYPRPPPAAGPFRRLRDAIIERIWPGAEDAPKLPTSAIELTSTPRNYYARYGRDVVLRFKIGSKEDAEALYRTTINLYPDIWEATNDWVDIRLAKDMVAPFLELLPPSLQGNNVPLIQDLASAVYQTYPDPPVIESSPRQSTLTHTHLTRLKDNMPHDLFFQDYQPLSVLYPWMRLLASLFPTHASLITIGTTFEGRDIHGLRLGTQADYTNGDDHSKRQTLLIVGGSHAREWISVSTVAYIAYSLVTRYGHPQFRDVTKLLDHFDLVFIPVLNPDGYEFTWTNDRLWRKNRQDNDLEWCRGIDLDRAFEFGWDGYDKVHNPCRDDYGGSGPLEAVEARALTNWARNEADNNNVTFVSYLDFHSYSQEVLYPYSYTCDTAPPNLEDLEEVALGIAKSFRLTNGHYYGVESACEGDFAFSKNAKARHQITSQGGSALDFFYHDMAVKLAFQIKLRDTGTYGFLLPRTHILPTGEEAYEGIVGLGRWLLGNHGIERYEDSGSIWGREVPFEASQVSVEQDDDWSTFEGDNEDELNENDLELRRRSR
jgi:extracellular matrix protein 14